MLTITVIFDQIFDVNWRRSNITQCVLLYLIVTCMRESEEYALLWVSVSVGQQATTFFIGQNGLKLLKIKRSVRDFPETYLRFIRFDFKHFFITLFVSFSSKCYTAHILYIKPTPAYLFAC